MNRTTRYGICTDQSLPYSTLVDRWRLYEELGFDSIWDCDHFMRPSNPGSDYFEGWTLLAALGAETSRIRVGCLVASNTFRHPALLAQQAITIDHITDGRLELGIGAGWFVEEHERFGLQFGSPGELVDRFQEAVEVIDSLLRDETTDYQGRYYQLQGARLRPEPVQRPRPPLTMGAHKPRMLGICARFADRWNSYGTVEEMAHRNRLLDEACMKIGRNPAEIIRSFYGWVPSLESMGMPDPWGSPDAFSEVVGRYTEVGMNEFIFDQPRPDQLDQAAQIAARIF
ncbi:MAG: LLM class flavin-dependent oxidoreductase [Acidimicrobiia bacterium]|nr:LLM class flavin-dependent oxidoreductase [Acidimicrobiia bacterium]MYF27073.1 LLM class flavin-dependent oxidoreductase [Acidimicrobiia bacterium]